MGPRRRSPRTLERSPSGEDARNLPDGPLGTPIAVEAGLRRQFRQFLVADVVEGPHRLDIKRPLAWRLGENCPRGVLSCTTTHEPIDFSTSMFVHGPLLIASEQRNPFHNNTYIKIDKSKSAKQKTPERVFFVGSKIDLFNSTLATYKFLLKFCAAPASAPSCFRLKSRVILFKLDFSSNFFDLLL